MFGLLLWVIRFGNEIRRLAPDLLMTESEKEFSEWIDGALAKHGVEVRRDGNRPVHFA